MSKKKRKKPQAGRGKAKGRIPNIKQELRAIFTMNPDEAFTIQQITKRLGIRDARSKTVLKDLIFSLESKGAIRKNRDNRWTSTMVPTEYEGIVDHVNPRFAYILVEELEEDIWVKTEDLNFA